MPSGLSGPEWTWWTKVGGLIAPLGPLRPLGLLRVPRAFA
jgi:hypothetical protein